MKSKSNIEINRRLNYLLSLGITNKPIQQLQFTDSPKFSDYICYHNLPNFAPYEIFGAGISLDNDLAMLKAVAECTERISLEQPKQFHKTTFESGAMLDPSIFINFSNEQLFGKRSEFISDVKNSEYLCVPAHDYLHDKDCLVPGQLAYLTTFRNEPVLRDRNSNGAAAGFSFEEAFFNGIMELVERDAFMIAYLKQNKPPKLDYSGIDRINKLAKYFQRYNLDFQLFDITSDLNIPVIMAVNIDRTGIGPAINLGLGCSLDLETAAIKASLESNLGYNHIRYVKETRGLDEIKSVSDIDTIAKRSAYWYSTNNIEFIEAWLNTSDTVILKDTNTENNEFEKVLSIIKERDYTLLSVDITPEQLQSTSIKVIKAIIPELHPFYLNEKFKALYSVHAGNIPEENLPPQPFL